MAAMAASAVIGPEKTMLMECYDPDGAIGSLIGTLSLTTESEDSCQSTDILGTSDEDKTSRLLNMVCELEMMDTAWREAIMEQPSAVEQTLYMLILGHVRSDLYLYHREKIIDMPPPPEDGLEFIVNELKKKGSEFGVTMTTCGEDGYKDEVEFFNVKNILADTSSHMDLILGGLEDLRCSVSGDVHMSLPAKVLSDQSTELETNYGEVVPERVKQVKEFPDMKIREKILVDILCSLSEVRRERSYAPPADNELTYYREIRKWVTSIITFFRAKEGWLSSWVFTKESSEWEKMEGAVCVDRFPVERVRKCSATDCEFTIIADATYGVEFHAPIGHRTAAIMYELPDFRFILSRLKGRFSDISQKFGQKGASKNVATCIDTVNTGFDGRKRAQMQESLQARKEKKQGLGGDENADVPAKSSNPTERDEVPQGESRGKYLTEILSFFPGVENLSSSQSWLADTEVRLYARILEHVRASIWLFNKSATVREVKLYKQLMDAESKVPVMLKEGPRGQRLEEIVSLVEKIEIESSFSTPTAEEVVLYEKIQGHMNVNLMEWMCYKKLEMEGNFTSGPADHQQDLEVAARSVLKAIWAREIEIADELEKESSIALRTLFPQVPSGATNAFEWLAENMDAVLSDLSEQLRLSQQAYEFLDMLLLNLVELDWLLDDIKAKFSFTNIFLFCILRERKIYRVPLMECWSAFLAERS